MKQQIPLRRFEYCIADAGATAKDRQGSDSHSIDTDDTHFRLVSVDIDFEKRNLSLEGISLMPDGSQRLRRTRSGADDERIMVNATICPGSGVYLSDNSDDGFVLSLKGFLEDSKTINSCSGSLMLYFVPEKNGGDGGEWCLAVSLCDDNDDRRAIRLHLEMWAPVEHAELN